jgi:hypothetical protein
MRQPQEICGWRFLINVKAFQSIAIFKKMMYNDLIKARF